MCIQKSRIKFSFLFFKCTLLLELLSYVYFEHYFTSIPLLDYMLDSSWPARRQLNERRMEARDPLGRDPLRREENSEIAESGLLVNEGEGRLTW
jgi:hypothetical protein